MSDSELTVASRGIWIPNEVWENPGLSIQEKALLARIHSFEECFASNQYLADFLGLSVTRTKELITSLCRSGYLHREEERKGRMTVKRILSVDKVKYFGIDGHRPENRPTPAGKPSEGGPESRHHSYKELVKENSNTVIGTSADAPCSVCCGNGFIVDDMGHGMYRDVPCHNCSGTGKEPTCNDGLHVRDVRNSRTTELSGNAGELHCTDKPSEPEQATQAAAENSKPDGSAATDKQRNRYPEEFEWLWTHKPERLGGNGKKSAYNACRARIKQGATWRELAEGMKRYAAHCKAEGKLNTPYVMQMQTFFGPDEHYKASWGAKPQQSAQVGAVSPTQEPRAALASELTPEQLAATRERLKNMMKGA